jgi:hypothetical protein
MLEMLQSVLQKLARKRTPRQMKIYSRHRSWLRLHSLKDVTSNSLVQPNHVRVQGRVCVLVLVLQDVLQDPHIVRPISIPTTLTINLGHPLPHFQIHRMTHYRTWTLLSVVLGMIYIIGNNVQVVVVTFPIPHLCSRMRTQRLCCSHTRCTHHYVRDTRCSSIPCVLFTPMAEPYHLRSAPLSPFPRQSRSHPRRTLDHTHAIRRPQHS